MTEKKRQSYKPQRETENAVCGCPDRILKGDR